MTDADAPLPSDVPDTSVGGVLDWVGDDLAKCEAAIAAEQAGKKRATLLASLDALRVRLTAQPDAGEPGVDDNDAPGADHGMCKEHFPAGWRTAAITRTEAVTGTRQPSVTCEHGTYHRPAE